LGGKLGEGHSGGFDWAVRRARLIAEAPRRREFLTNMPHYPYLIVGGGMTADAAARAIRQADPNGAVGLISAEPHPPYARPPLSKGLWKGDPETGIWRGTETAGVELRLARRVTSIDAKRKTVTDERGDTVTYGKLLLATGGTPRRLPFDTKEIIYYRTYDDYRRLRGLANQRPRFAVLGGGFIGSEIAAALRLAGRDVVMLVPEDGIGARVFPADLSHFLVDYYREQGVEVRKGEGLAGLTPGAVRLMVQTTHGQEFTVDVVVAGLGIQPNVDLAEQAGLRVDNGIVVDEQLRTSVPDIFAAGDVANFFNPALGVRMRVEHEDNANTMGAAAGRAMAGQGTPYTHLPFFYSDLFALGYEAVGELDPRLETVADWKVPFREGVVYYLKNGRVRGVLLWNTWGQVDAARALIAEPGPFRAESLRGRLPA
jgi:3-phenylpropionate/trans-cinnamate dioxygenase ferredoxin reductase subunit